MTFGQILSVLRARWMIALAVLLAVLGLTLAISLSITPQYTAVASVVVDAKPDPVSALVYPQGASPALMATQTDIIQSDRVARRVVTSLRLAENPQVRQQWQEETGGKGSMEGWLATRIAKKMDVKPSRESNVIAVSYTAGDPTFAAAMANAFMQAYLDTVLEMRVNPARQYSAFFDTRSKDARDALERAQRKLSEFQRAKGIIATDERLDVENARLNDLSSQLVALQTLSAESSSRQTQAQGRSAENLQDVLNHPLIAGLKADLSRQESRLQEVGSRLGDAHPQVIEIKASVAELRRRIAAETQRITSGVGITNSINRARESQIRAELEAQRAKVLKMKEVRDEGLLLAREVENAQRTFDTVLARLNQSSLESQTTLSNAMPLSPALPPTEPSSPKIGLNMALAILLGSLLAIGATLLLELSNRRVRAVQDVALPGIPVLGLLPKPGSRRGARPALLEQRLLGQLPAPTRST